MTKRKPTSQLKSKKWKEGRPVLQPFSDGHIAALLQAVVTAIMTQQLNINLVASIYTEFPKGFPFKVRLKTENGLDYFKMRAKPLFYWMIEKGYTDLTMDKLRVAQILHTKKEKELFGE